MMIQTKIEQYTKEQKEDIRNAKACGLDFYGEVKNGQPVYIGNNLAWSIFNDGNF
jgi:hypothetical protein